MSSYINMKSRRSFTFAAPYNEEGERTVVIPFPVAVKRAVENNALVHDANPALVEVSPKAEETVTVETKVQPGSLMIVRNTGSEPIVIGGTLCESGKVSTLMYDGNAYVVIGSSEIP